MISNSLGPGTYAGLVGNVSCIGRVWTLNVELFKDISKKLKNGTSRRSNTGKLESPSFQAEAGEGQ